MQIEPQKFQILTQNIKASINQVIVGKSDVMDQLIIALTTGGHVLIEDVPGIGKTTIVSALARSIDLSFNRIQFTPDLMPSDLTGFNYYNPKSGEFVFQEGLLMSHLVLADEINRTSPKTQSALLEVMQEQQITIDHQSIKLPEPFMVLATQNPIEFVGTYPLPEAQLDRFMLKVSLGYPTKDEELAILDIHDTQQKLQLIKPVCNQQDILWMKQQVNLVHVDDKIKQYIVNLMHATRQHPDLIIGASPRAAQALLKASKALALILGREYVIPDDVMRLAASVLSHRLNLKAEKKLLNHSVENVLTELLKTIKV